MEEDIKSAVHAHLCAEHGRIQQDLDALLNPPKGLRPRKRVKGCMNIVRTAAHLQRKLKQVENQLQHL